MKKIALVTVLGSTGSVGESTLDVIARHPDRFGIYALSAHSRIEALAAQCAKTRAKVAVVPDDAARLRFIDVWPSAIEMPEIRVGAKALEETAADAESPIVMAAIVGAAGLPSALAAARAGKRILLANKEALVAAGHLFMNTVRQHGAELLPIDSEHNAIFQCLPQNTRANAPSTSPIGVRRLVLTASGGPFRLTKLDALASVTPDQACAHPNWSMGRKISVDSATMLNKGLEVIEAHWLFAMPAEKISVVIHPQSIVHSMVEYEDGSVVAQLGLPDMRTPIAYGLGFPDRIPSGVGALDLVGHGRLDFEAPDLRKFECLQLAFSALAAGQGACIALNAANEVAVAAFLDRGLKYLDIPRVIHKTLEGYSARDTSAPNSLDDVLALDQRARLDAEHFVTESLLTSH